MDSELKIGESVIVPWGLAEVRGNVVEVYGRGQRVHVVIRLSPDVSGDVVDEPTTVSLPIDDVRRVGVAA
ncbi:MAG: hypothetical protein IT195_05675 [Microthrixaceae bacterium]|nr:hypothetical protein [Microthrixaceae bacterium]